MISTKQPLGNLVRVLFEPSPELEDSVTYDITAWEMHYAYGVEGFALKNDIETTDISFDNLPLSSATNEKPYAYIAKWNSMDDMKFLAALLNENIRPRFVEKGFSLEGKNYEAGTLVITRNGNHLMGNLFDDKVKTIADLHNRELHAVSTGFVDTGLDFGSSSVRLIDAPHIGLIAGSETSSTMVGHIWHFFDQQIKYPVTMLNMDELGSIEWTDYDVMIMPSGYYGDTFDEDGINELMSWVRDGGVLIAVEGANNFLSNQEGIALHRKSGNRTGSQSEDPESKLRVYGDSERNFISNFNAGSIYELSMDTTHPLAFGYDSKYMSLKLGSTAFEYLDNGWNVGVAKSGTPRSGFVGANVQDNLEHSLSYGVQNMGAGSIVYMIDNPFYRGFWHNGKLLVGNAIFFLSN